MSDELPLKRPCLEVITPEGAAEYNARMDEYNDSLIATLKISEDRLTRLPPVPWAPLAEDQYMVYSIHSVARADFSLEAVQKIIRECKGPYGRCYLTYAAVNNYYWISLALESVVAQRATLLHSPHLWSRFASRPVAHPTLVSPLDYSDDQPFFRVFYEPSRPLKEVVFVVTSQPNEPPLFSRAHYASSHEHVAFVCISPSVVALVPTIFTTYDSKDIYAILDRIDPGAASYRILHSELISSLMRRISEPLDGRDGLRFHVPTSLVFHDMVETRSPSELAAIMPYANKEKFVSFLADAAEFGEVAIYLRPRLTKLLLGSHYEIQTHPDVRRVTQQYAPSKDVIPRHPFVQHLVDTLPIEHTFGQYDGIRLVAPRADGGSPFHCDAIPSWMFPEVDPLDDPLPPTCHVVHAPSRKGCIVYTFLPF